MRDSLDRSRGQGAGREQEPAAPASGPVGRRPAAAEQGSAGDERAQGAVRITLPTDMVAERVGRVWLLLAFTGCSALTAVAALAFAFARWAGRPIRQLEEATHQLADGGQATPVAVTSGPPEIRSLAAAFNRTAAATTGGLDAMVRLPSAQSHEPPAGKPGPRRREAPVLRA